MFLNKLQLKHFRNYEELSLDFKKNLVIFLGDNAQGKTNILESIYCLALTKSHRTNNEQELISFEGDQAYLFGEVKKGHQQIPLELFLTKKGRKCKVNHIEQKLLSSYIGQMNVILFAPEDLSLVKGSPQVRRKFLDMEIGQMNRVYLHELQQYQKVLKQRNQYLKQAAINQKFDAVYFEILTEQLVEHGSKVLLTRAQFTKELEHWANGLHQKISHEKETLTLRYDSLLKSLDTLDLAQIQAEYQAKLAEQLDKERQRQSTLIGPHRDDLLFFINGKNVQNFGSQGQQRTTALSVKLAEIDLMHQETGEYPILLLDDVMSELDDLRQLHLLQTIENKVQTFLTTTTLNHLKDKMTLEPEIYYVSHGTIQTKASEERSGL